jgi:hypothetical protein
VLHHEQYEWGEAQREAIETLDEKFKEFQKEQGLPDQGDLSALSRVRGPRR